MESNSTAILIKIKLRHSLGRPSRSDFVQSDFDVELEDVDGEKTKIDYYQYDTNFYAAVVGQKVYLVNKMTVKELIDSYKTLVGQTDSESSDENSDLVSEENATDEDSNSADNTDNTNGVDVD